MITNMTIYLKIIGDEFYFSCSEKALNYLEEKYIDRELMTKLHTRIDGDKCFWLKGSTKFRLKLLSELSNDPVLSTIL